MSFVMENDRENHNLRKVSYDKKKTGENESHKSEDRDANDNFKAKDDKKYPYPKGIPFIVSTEFCERFSYYGMKTVLSLYFTQSLKYSEDQATMLYHGFNFLCYFTPIIGSIIADSFFGKFKTILYLSLVYAIGEAILTVGSIGDTENGNEGIEGLPASAMAFIGLALIGLGTGGIKPCVSTFGGEQFKVPEQSAYVATFFSIFYASINAGSLISTILTPYLRTAFQCFGQDSCFPLAFGVPSILMVVAVVVFLCGRIFGLYKLTMPENNVIVETAKCIWCSWVEKSKRGKKEKLPETLDYAENRFGKNFVADVKALKNVSYMFIPFPLFWALFDQQGSRWLFQATRMDGNFFGYTIPADSFQAVNPIMILLFIPLFDFVIYPLLAKIRLCRTDLQKIVTGGVLAGIAFVVSGILELELVKTYPHLPEAGTMHLSIYNGFNSVNTYKFCNSFEVKSANGNVNNLLLRNSVEEIFITEDNYSINMGSCIQGDISFNTTQFQPPKMVFTEGCKENCQSPSQSILVTLNLNDTTGNSGLLWGSQYRERLDKSSDGHPYIRMIWNVKTEKSLKLIVHSMEEKSKSLTLKSLNGLGDTVPETFPSLGEVTISLVDEMSDVIISKTNTTFKIGGNYQILVQYRDDGIFSEPIYVHEITEPNSISIFWQLPQIMIITAGEIMFSITSLKFAFSQAPESMKAVIMAIQLLTNAIGNAITLLLTLALEGVFTYDELAYNFFLFAGLMILDMIILAWMAKRYQYIDNYNSSAEFKEKDDSKI